jgi:pyruvate,water dikinase
LRIHDLLTAYAADAAAAALDELVVAVSERGLDEQRLVLEGALLCRVVPHGEPARRLVEAFLRGGRRVATESIVAGLIEEVNRRHDLLCRNHRKRIASIDSAEELERQRHRLRRLTERDRILLKDLGGSGDELEARFSSVAREIERRARAVRFEVTARARAALALDDAAIRRDLGTLERLAKEAKASSVEPETVARLVRRLAGPLESRRARAGKTLVVELSRVEAADRALVGGKAAGLMRLRGHLPSGCRVPDGFVIATPAYRLHLAAGTADELREMLERGDADLEVSRRARQAILAQAVPREVERAVRRAAERFGNTRLAVRSSATIEDTADSSLAGLFDSSLGTGGREPLFDRVRRIWASFWNPHALHWLTEMGRSPLDAAMAVLVQELVTTRVAGVLFTRDPEDPAGSMLVNAAWGLGEAISTGAVAGDVFWIHRERGEIVAVRPGGSDRRFVPDPGRRGILAEALPEDLRGRACLDAGQISRLADAGKHVEARSGAAMGIEFGFDDEGTLLLFQARRVPGGAE